MATASFHQGYYIRFFDSQISKTVIDGGLDQIGEYSVTGREKDSAQALPDLNPDTRGASLATKTEQISLTA